MKTSNITSDASAKREVINSIYSSMISIAQEIRAASERLTVWGCGVQLLIVGWLVTSEGSISLAARLFVSVSVVIFAGILTAIVRSFNKRYRGVALVIQRINWIQGAHTPGEYIDDLALMPPAWKDFGSERWREPIFRISYVSIWIVATVAIVGAWLIEPKKKSGVAESSQLNLNTQLSKDCGRRS